MRSLKISLTLLMLLLLAPIKTLALITNENEMDTPTYLILVEINSKNLILYELIGKEKTEIKRFPVATPVYPKALPLPLTGTVIKTEINPVWYPTPATRAAYFKKHGKELPQSVSANDSRNAMGKAQLVIKYENTDLPIRIHGNNDPDSIGKSATRGCIRMFNKDILTLIEIIKNHNTQVIIQ